MPNHCQNRVTVLGPSADVAAFVAAAEGEEQRYEPSRSEVEWAAKGGPPIDRERKRSVFSFHALVPIPPEVEAQSYDPAGYEAEKRLWGVKWGAYDVSRTVRDGRADYSFTTAWAPPYEFLLTVSELFKSLRFLISYSEEYPTRGRAIVSKGEIQELAGEEPADDGSSYQRYSEGCDEDAVYESKRAWQDLYTSTHDAWVDSGGMP